MDLSKVKEEISRRKEESNKVSMQLGENINTATSIPKDAFLNELLMSRETGKESVATNLIKNIDNHAAIRNKEKPVYTETKTINQPIRNINNDIDGIEREEQLYRNLENNRKKTLDESLNNYTANPTFQQAPMQQQPLNETLINNVHKIVNNYITEGLGNIVEETIKSTIIELFAAEKIKEVLYENKDMIQKIVIETIKSIQAKKKT